MIIRNQISVTQKIDVKIFILLKNIMEPEPKKPKLDIFEEYKKILDIISLPKGFELVGVNEDDIPIFWTTNNYVLLVYCSTQKEGFNFDQDKLVAFAVSRYSELSRFRFMDLRQILNAVRWHPLVVEFAKQENHRIDPDTMKPLKKYTIGHYNMDPHSCLIVKMPSMCSGLDYEYIRCYKLTDIEKYKTSHYDFYSSFSKFYDVTWLYREE